MGSTVIPIPEEQQQPQISNEFSYEENHRRLCFVIEENDKRKVIHGVKVGVGLVLVSLIYFLDPFYEEIGDDNAMWAVMTVVVISEFYAGATLAKGLNRGMGTIMGGGLGILVALVSQKVSTVWNSILVGTAMLLVGGIATYWRMKPKFKAKFDYGAVIFILTFSLVALSGLREAEPVIEIARERLLMIVLGFAVCVFTSLFVFPTWASDELHDSTVSKFNCLASSIEEEYFRLESCEKEERNPEVAFSKCKTVLNSNTKDESLANFARWEPWHGKFGMSYPWKKYLEIGETLREVAATLLALKSCLVQSPRHHKQRMKQSLKGPCEVMGASLAWALRELAESIKSMRKCNPEDLIKPDLKSVKLVLNRMIYELSLVRFENGDGLGISSLVYLLMDMEDKIEELAEQVKELGEVAYFSDNSTVKN